mgnify:CR=1 FL=1
MLPLISKWLLDRVSIISVIIKPSCEERSSLFAKELSVNTSSFAFVRLTSLYKYIIRKDELRPSDLVLLLNIRRLNNLRRQAKY